MSAQTSFQIDVAIFDRLSDLRAQTHTVCLSRKHADAVWRCANQALNRALDDLDAL
jgi:hypothetical protein